MDKMRLLVALHYIRTCFRWGLFSVITGLLCGCLGGAFCLFIQWSNEIRADHTWLLFLLPVAGLLIVRLYRMFGIEEDRGADLIFDSVRTTEDIPFQVIIVSFLSTIFTHLFGGSAGRVGVAMQMGGGISALLSRRVGLSDKDRSLFVMCGMAGLITALFGTPLMATFLAMEVVSLGVIYYAALLPCLVTSLTTYFVTRFLGLAPMQFTIHELPKLNGVSFMKVAVLGVACAVVSMLFCGFMMFVSSTLKKKVPNQYVRVLIGSGLIILLTLLVGNQTYNGSSAALLEQAIVYGEAHPWDFLLKLIFTGITLQSGYKGGGVYPALIIGATFGCWFGPLIGMDASLAAGIGMVAVFCGSVNCPIASILFAAEVFGSDHLLLFAIAAAISFVFSGYLTIFPGQEFIYSKLRMEYKNSGLREDE
ncbi:MAG: chloride channel protein [Lachnospiraceae bacterium]|nr:chloride channel protein [Lachnospiraceae bacterium]